MKLVSATDPSAVVEERVQAVVVSGYQAKSLTDDLVVPLERCGFSRDVIRLEDNPVAHAIATMPERKRLGI